MIDIQSLDLSSLPWLPLDARSAFPRQPAIYFAIDARGDIQYIGKAVDVKTRWGNHHRYDQLQEIGGIRIAYLFVDDPSLLIPIENALIAWFDPPLNVVGGNESLRRVTIPGRRYLFCRLPNLMVEKDPRLTQRKLAVELGISHTTINKLYNGQPLTARIDPETVERICDYFECEVGDLFCLKGVAE